MPRELLPVSDLPGTANEFPIVANANSGGSIEAVTDKGTVRLRAPVAPADLKHLEVLDVELRIATSVDGNILELKAFSSGAEPPTTYVLSYRIDDGPATQIELDVTAPTFSLPKESALYAFELFARNSTEEVSRSFQIEVAIPPGPALPGDANDDKKVDFADFLILSANFGRRGATDSDGDFNGDGLVSFADFLILADKFRA